MCKKETLLSEWLPVGMIIINLSLMLENGSDNIYNFKQGEVIMKKLLIGLVLSISVVMASDMHQDDLLSMATMGKTTGTQFEMNNDEMKDVDGGYTFSNSLYTRYIYGYSYYDRKNSNSSYTRTYSSGNTYSWSTRTYGGYTWMSY